MDQDFPATAPDHDHPSFKTRKDDRTHVNEAAQLRPQALYAVEVKVRNVSTTGFMAECPESVRIGSYVELEVPGLGSVHAQIRWQIAGRMGGMFLDPISLDRCEWIAVRTSVLED